MAFEDIRAQFKGHSALELDFIDNINGYWSVLLLAVCAVGALLLQCFGEPVQCWTPAQFENSQVKYTDTYSLLANTYIQPRFDSPIPPRDQDQPPIISSYHLVVPLVLFFMAIGYKTPYLIWQLFKHCLSIDLDSMTTTLEVAQTTNPVASKTLLREAAAVLLQFLTNNRILLSISYLVIKLLVCVNLLAQFIALSIYFGERLSLTSRSSIEYFPYVVHTDFAIRQLQNVHRYSVQCVIPMNDIFLRMFVFLWYWTLFVALLTFVNLLITAGVIFVPLFRDSRLTAYVCADKSLQGSAQGVAGFVSGTLGYDGAFLLTRIARNRNELLAASLTQELWRIHKQNAPVYCATTSGPEYCDN